MYETVYDVGRLIDATLCLALCVLILAFYAHPKVKMPAWRGWAVVSWWLFVLSNAWTDLVRLGEAADGRLPLRLVASIIGVFAMIYTLRQRHLDSSWTGQGPKR